MRRLSSISGRRSSNYSSHSSGVGGNDSSGRRSSAVNRKSSLDLLKGSGGEYRPRSEHTLLTHAEDEENKTQKRRSSFLGKAMRRLSSSGNLRALAGKSKSTRDIAMSATSSPLASSSSSLTSSSEHGPSQRKGSFFRNLRRKSSGAEEEQEGETLRHTYHG